MITPEQFILGLRVLAGVTAAFWLLVVFDRKRWWPSDWSLHLDAAARPSRPGWGGTIAVVVPARNEAANLPRTLPRLLKQCDWYDTLVVVDDRSTDPSASIVRRLARGTPAEEKVQVVQVEECPEGWTGKVNAMERGVAVATRGWAGDPTAQWILFTDADILHPTTSLSRLMSMATAGEYDLVSVMVRLHTRTFWEQLLIPAFTYFFQFLYPFKRASDARSRVAAAAGGCLLVRRSLLEEIGGMESIKGHLIDDVALARAVKRAGGKCWLGLDPDMTSVRTYPQLDDVVTMVSRTAFEGIGHRYLMVPVVWLWLGVCFVSPPLMVIAGAVLLDPVIASAAAAAWVLQAATYLPVVQYLGAASGNAALLPLAALAFGWMTTLSAIRHLTGHATSWRETTTEVDLTNG